MLFLRSILFAVLVPGTTVLLIPYMIVPAMKPTRWSLAEYGALIPICIGATILFWCIRDFAVAGQGTVAPVDPPTRLVRNGLYRHVRNPMYLGALLVLLGETALFRSVALLAYAGVWFAAVNLLVVLYEEPALRRRFGASYTMYCHSVRWFPRRPFNGAA